MPWLKQSALMKKPFGPVPVVRESLEPSLGGERCTICGAKEICIVVIYVSLAVYYDVSAHGLLSSEGWFLAARKVRHIVNL